MSMTTITAKRFEVFKFFATAFCFLAIFTLSPSFAHDNQKTEQIEVPVVYVIDGDTIKVDYPVLGEISVRLIGIDTPETKRNDRAKLQANEDKIDLEAVVKMGKEAKKHLETMVKKGDLVTLVFDIEKMDRYSRLLAYVYKENRMLNMKMVTDGYAYPLTIPPNVAFADEFVKEYRKARDTEKGLWRNH